MPEQPERMRVAYVDDKSVLRANDLPLKRQSEAAEAALQNEKNIAILKEKIASGEISRFDCAVELFTLTCYTFCVSALRQKL